MARHAPVPSVRATAADSPFSAAWRNGTLRSFAHRAAAGEDPDELRAALLEHLWPWAQHVADGAARRLPAGADAAETRSQVLGAVWHATSQIDWERWETWPALLLRRVRGARIDAARHDDAVSRRDRDVLNRIDDAVAAAELACGRTLSAAERDQVRADELSRLSVRRRRALEGAVTGPTMLVDSFAPTLVDERWNPEASTVASARSEGLHRWLRHDVPPEVRTHLLHLLAEECHRASVPARLRSRLRPYLPSLVERVGDTDDAALVGAGR